MLMLVILSYGEFRNNAYKGGRGSEKGQNLFTQYENAR